MTAIPLVGWLVPLVSVYTYRRAGATWRSAAGISAVAVLASFVVSILIGFVYGFGISIAAGLCGDTPWEATAAGVAAFVVAGSWAMLKPSRWWMWPLATGGGFAATILVSYFFTSAHAYCET